MSQNQNAMPQPDISSNPYANFVEPGIVADHGYPVTVGVADGGVELYVRPGNPDAEMIERAASVGIQQVADSRRLHGVGGTETSDDYYDLYQQTSSTRDAVRDLRRRDHEANDPVRFDAQAAAIVTNGLHHILHEAKVGAEGGHDTMVSELGERAATLLTDMQRMQGHAESAQQPAPEQTIQPKQYPEPPDRGAFTRPT